MAQYKYSKEFLEKVISFSGADSNDLSFAKLSYHAALAASVKKQIEQYQSFKNPTILSIALEKKTIQSIEERVAFLNGKILLGREIIAETKKAEAYEREQFEKYSAQHPELFKKSSRRKQLAETKERTNG